MTNINGWAFAPVPLAALIFGGIILAWVVIYAHTLRAEWKRVARYHEKTLASIVELDPAFGRVFGRRGLDERCEWEWKLDGGKIQRLAGISRRKNERNEDTSALRRAQADLKQERRNA